MLLDKNKEVTRIFIHSFMKFENGVKEFGDIFNRKRDKNYRDFSTTLTGLVYRIKVCLDIIIFIKCYQMIMSFILGSHRIRGYISSTPFTVHPHTAHLNTPNHLLTRFLTATLSLSIVKPQFLQTRVLPSSSVFNLLHLGQVFDEFAGLT